MLGLRLVIVRIGSAIVRARFIAHHHSPLRHQKQGWTEERVARIPPQLCACGDRDTGPHRPRASYHASAKTFAAIPLRNAAFVSSLSASESSASKTLAA